MAKVQIAKKDEKSSFARSAQQLWKRIFTKALKQYGQRAQAERIANCAVTPIPKVKARRKKAAA